MKLFKRKGDGLRGKTMTVTEMANYALKKQDYEKATSKQGSSDSEGNQSIPT